MLTRNAFFAAVATTAMMLPTGCTEIQPRFLDIQGHRGARAVRPENSIPGFLYAAGIGVTTLELDVIVTSAKDIVVSHEPWLNPDICTGPNGEALSGAPRRSLYPMPLADIRQCDCGRHGHPRFPNQQRMLTHKPTLAEVAAAVAEGERPEGMPPVAFNIEIKHNADEVGVHFPEAGVAASLVLAEIQRLGITDRTTVQSFSAEVLEAVHAAQVGVRTAWLMEEERTVNEALSLLSFRPDIYSPHHVLLSPEEIAAAHQLGVAVVPWTVNDPQRMAELIGWGVDGLISDDPGLALQVSQTQPETP